MLYCLSVTFNWDDEKNEKLKQERGISFEEIVLCINDGQIVAVVEHPNKERYPNQLLYLVEHRSYVYVVPFVENKGEIFLKTVFPSRYYTKRYLRKEDDQENE